MSINSTTMLLKVMRCNSDQWPGHWCRDAHVQQARIKAPQLHATAPLVPVPMCGTEHNTCTAYHPAASHVVVGVSPEATVVPLLEISAAHTSCSGRWLVSGRNLSLSRGSATPYTNRIGEDKVRVRLVT